ncbi:MAG: alpha/beta fold hydrolase [Bacteroidales bacterium]|nr:alpha/beta fold hydrolase [Bacteroidales bacterium]
MSKTLLNDIDLYYETHGKGTPLLLIAGLASDSQSWQPVIAGLSRHFFVITPDSRGVGRTMPQETEISIGKIADDCIALIKHLGFSSVNVLGHSMGGFVALDLAIRYPDYVNSLILAGTSSSNSMRNNAMFMDLASCLESGMEMKLWFRNLFYWIFSPRFFENKEAVNDAVRFSIEYPYPQSPVAFRNQVMAIADYDGTDDLAKICSKTLVICGKEDLLFPPEVGEALAQAIPGADFSVIKCAPHSMYTEQPQAFTNCVLDFLLDS